MQTARVSFDSQSVTVELTRNNPPRSVTGTGATYEEAFSAAQCEARGRWFTPEPQPWNVPPLTDQQINEIFEPVEDGNKDQDGNVIDNS